MEEVFKSAVKGVLDYMKNGKLKSMVLGISGGIDSTVCAAICHEVTRQNPDLEFYGVSLPCSTNQECEVSAADIVGKAFFEDGKFWTRSLEKEYLTLLECTEEQVESTPISRGNIKARLRMIYLRNLAGIKKGLVIDTDNLTEHYLGFFTIAGDVGDLSPIAQLWKHEVYELGRWILSDYCETQDQREALSQSLSLIPTDGNGVKEGGDLAQIAPSLSTYDQVDEIIDAYLDYKKKPDDANLFFLNQVTDKYGEEVVGQVLSRVRGSEFKRLPSPVIIQLSGIERNKFDKKEMLKRVGN